MVLAAVTDVAYYQQIIDIFERYGSFGPLIAILLPLLEAFLPFLPLFVFVFANAASFGFWAGFFYSWLGSCIGTILVFIIIRKYGQTRFFRFLNRHPRIESLISRMDERGFGPIFLIFCFPFTPSALVNAVAALSRINMLDFILALTLGKAVMIGTISFIGYDLRSFFYSPMKAVVVLGGIALLWFVGKFIENKLGLAEHKKTDKIGWSEKWGKKKRKQRSNG